MTARASRARRVAAATVGLGALLLAPALAGAGQTEAAWTNREHSTTTATAGTVAAPLVGSTCTVAPLGLSSTFFWQAPTGGLPRTGYVVGIYANNVLVGSELLLAATATQRSTAGLLSSLDGRVYQFRIQAYTNFAGGGQWRSTPLYGTITTTALGLISSCSGLRTTP